MSSRRLLPIVLALAAGFAGGCSDGKVKEANTYVNAVNQAQGAFATTSDKLITEITPDSSAARRRIAPVRSRHQPSGREPITFIPSTIPRVTPAKVACRA